MLEGSDKESSHKSAYLHDIFDDVNFSNFLFREDGFEFSPPIDDIHFNFSEEPLSFSSNFVPADADQAPVQQAQEEMVTSLSSKAKSPKIQSSLKSSSDVTELSPAKEVRSLGNSLEDGAHISQEGPSEVKITRVPIKKLLIRIKRPIIEAITTNYKEDVMPRTKGEQYEDDDEFESAREAKRKRRRDYYHKAKNRKKQELIDFKSRISELEEENEEFELTNQQLESENQEMKVAHEKLEATYQELQESHQGQQETLEALEQTHIALVNKHKALEGQHKDFKADYLAQEKQQADLLEQLSKLQNHMDEVKSVQHLASSEEQVSKEASAAYQSKILALTTLCQQLQGMVHDLSAKNEQVVSENASLKSELINMKMDRVSSQIKSGPQGESLLIAFDRSKVSVQRDRADELEGSASTPKSRFKL